MFFRSNTNNKGRTISWISIVTGLSVARPRPSTRRLPASISDFRRLLRRQVPAAIKDKPHLLPALQPCSPERQASWPGGRRSRPLPGPLLRPSRDDSSPAARTAMSRILPSEEEGGHHNCHRHRHPPDTTPRPDFPCPSRSSR